MDNRKIHPPRIAGFPFKKVKVPDQLYSDIMKEYSNMSFSQIIDDVEYSQEYQTYTSGAISVRGTNSPYTYFESISPSLNEKVYEKLTPIVQDWAGVELVKTWGYGIRSYIHNSILHLHRDRIDTHIISCIIFVDEKSNEPWPLDFYDHEYNHHQVTFEPGDMLFYESLCIHGRMEPFLGQYYRNMYFHWKPKDWEYSSLEEMKVLFKNETQIRNFYGVPLL